MRKKPKKKLTPLQENRLLKVIVAMSGIALLWLLFAPETGVYSLFRMRSRTAELERQTEELIEANEALRREIDRLHNDTEYLERLAREKYGLMKKNERLFDFSPPARQNNEQ